MGEVPTLGTGEVRSVVGAPVGFGAAVAEDKASMLSSCIALYTYSRVA
jgi:hypothetical protein